MLVIVYFSSLITVVLSIFITWKTARAWYVPIAEESENPRKAWWLSIFIFWVLIWLVFGIFVVIF